VNTKGKAPGSSLPIGKFFANLPPHIYIRAAARISEKNELPVRNLLKGIFMGKV
jgi:hypothetical protein